MGQEPASGPGAPIKKTFRASTPETKVVFSENGHDLLWQENDQLWVEGGTAPFTIETFTPGSAYAFFSGTAGELPTYRAVFPYDSSYGINGSGQLVCVLPAIQQTTGNRMVPWPLAVAKTRESDPTDLYFTHLTTAVQFTLGEGMTGVSQIVFQGNANEIVAGTCTVSFNTEGVPSTAISNPGTSIALQGDFVPGNTYVINVLGSANFSAGLTLKAYFEDGSYGTISSSTAVRFVPGVWINLSNGLNISQMGSPGQVSNLDEWRDLKARLQTGADISEYCTDGEIVLGCDLTLEQGDFLDVLNTPLNGGGHTIEISGLSQRGLINTLQASVHDLNLTGSIYYTGSSTAFSLASRVGGDVSIERVSSSVDIAVKTFDPANTQTLFLGGLVSTIDGPNTVVTFDGCTYSGTLSTLQHIHSVGGILGHGGGGSAPKAIFRNCTFAGTIEYSQSVEPSTNMNACRLGGLVGDASRQVVVSDCTSSGTINIHLNGFNLSGNNRGGVGGLVGRTTAPVDGYVMSCSVERSTNLSTITIYDALPEDHVFCQQIIGNTVESSNPTVSDVSEEGSVIFVDNSAPAPTDGHFDLLQVTGAYDRTTTYLDGTSYPDGINYMSYLIKTRDHNKIIFVDGGNSFDIDRLRQVLRDVANNHVDAWFITHPHSDHFGAMVSVLNNPQGVTIDRIYHSYSQRAFDTSSSGNPAKAFYAALDAQPDGVVVNLTEPGVRLDIDGVGIKVLNVTDEDISTNINDYSTVLRIWDDTKTVILMGDASVPASRKMMANFRADLDCDYLQLGHHGNKGPDEYFYRSVHFSYALVPTARWIWDAVDVFTPAQLRQHDNLDGSATRNIIRSILDDDHIITSYDHIDWWLVDPEPQGE